ncbi:MAG: hypothetical protein HYV28_16630 [Ignavibacteriales bacterium]|nr:hypothetical protein [Ignavibacteriales bacterium]
MKKSLSILALALVFILLGQTGFAQDKDVSPLRGTLKTEMPIEAQWDVLFNYDLQAVTGGLGNAGAVFIPGLNQFWVSRWSTPAGRIYVLNASGGIVDSFTTTATAVRTDNCYCHASCSNHTSSRSTRVN